MAKSRSRNKDDFALTFIDGRVSISDKNLKRAKQFADREKKRWIEDLFEKRAEAEAKKAEEEKRKRVEEKSKEEERRKQAEKMRRQAEEKRRREEEERKALALKERAEKAEAERQKKISELNEEKTMLQKELKFLKGLGSGKRRREIKDRIIIIDSKLEKI